jgi:hypothetical protein
MTAPAMISLRVRSLSSLHRAVFGTIPPNNQSIGSTIARHHEGVRLKRADNLLVGQWPRVGVLAVEAAHRIRLTSVATAFV